MGKVNVYADGYGNGPVVARVQYNDRLDFWDGSNWTDGGVGTHLGITKLRDGAFVLIHGTQWQGSRDWAEVVSPEQALQAILRTGHAEILDEKKFAPLKKLYEETMIKEETL